MESTSNDAVASGASALFFLVVLAVVFVVYLFMCYCGKRICEKCGKNPGILIWIPILQLIPLLQVAGLPVWMIVLFLIPFVGFVVGIIMWVKICQARGKSPLLVLGVILLPIIFIPYLAFSE